MTISRHILVLVPVAIAVAAVLTLEPTTFTITAHAQQTECCQNCMNKAADWTGECYEQNPDNEDYCTIAGLEMLFDCAQPCRPQCDWRENPRKMLENLKKQSPK